MKPRTSPAISARKKPKQERSARLVEDILEAALRVLAREGARRFTTVRVAEEAGVSVGSLYQYFPNKESLLFRLQADEWEETTSILDEILADQTRPPFERVRRALKTFFRSERDEAELRRALEDATALYRAAPESAKHREDVTRRVSRFMEEVLPKATAKERAFAAEVALTMMSALGKEVTETKRTRAEVDAWADVVSSMLIGYLERLAC
jgi:AcrR family transcriptional regulator